MDGGIMKKWLLLLLVTIILTSILSATTIKVAVLPLKRLDSASKYIQKFLTIRDLEHTFATNSKYELLNMKAIADTLNEKDVTDIDEMEKTDMAEIGKAVNADVVILGSISSVSDQVFSIQFRFYSMRTEELKSIRVDVVKDKKKRWEILQKDFLGKLDSFINDEMDKMTTLAIQAYRQEDYKASSQGFNTILNYDPTNKQAFLYLGMIALKQKNYDTAITNLNKALPDTLTKNDASTLRSLSDAYREKKDTAMMLSTMEKQAELQKDEELYLSIANLYVENKQNDKAESALQKALKIDPNYMNAKIRLAFLLYDDGKYAESIEYLEASADANPTNDLIARRLAIAYQKSDQTAKAIKRYEDSIVNSPTIAANYLNLAGLFRAVASDAAEKNNQVLVTENNQKALDTLNKLQKIEPDNAIMYLRFADTYLAMNKINESEVSANASLSQDGTQYQPYIILATINQRRGTDKYNQFIDLDKAFQKAYGRNADRIAKERDAARIASNNYFKKAEEQLRAARIRTSEPVVISDIDSKLSTIMQLINTTSKN
jgi:tetratricopeptide (TPR) repeat protein